MPLSSAQIVTLACQTARCPAFTAQAGQFLNSILSDLCQTYDFDVAKGTFNFTFNPGLTTPNNDFPNMAAGGGPYVLPADYLRAVKDEVIWFLQGVAYPMIPIDLSEWDWQVQQAGNQSYPFLWATDMSQAPPLAVVWPAPSGAYPVMVRYYRQMADIVMPETSAAVPWFPNQRYLLKQLSGMLMELTNDSRSQTFLGDGDPNNPGAQAILRNYLKLKDDKSDRAQRVTMDRRRFNRGNYSSLPNTKRVGW